MGKVPVSIPTGHISVKTKPIKIEVKKTSPINTRYFEYLKYLSILCFPILLKIGNFFFKYRGTIPVTLCNKPIGHAQPQTALPVKIPTAPSIIIGYKNSFRLKLLGSLNTLYTLSSIALSGHAEDAAGQALQ
jgi:hypothetical protein